MFIPGAGSSLRTVPVDRLRGSQRAYVYVFFLTKSAYGRFWHGAYVCDVRSRDRPAYNRDLLSNLFAVQFQLVLNIILFIYLLSCPSGMGSRSTNQGLCVVVLSLGHYKLITHPEK